MPSNCLPPILASARGEKVGTRVPESVSVSFDACDGIATTSLTWDFVAFGVALQADGRILVAGRDASSYVVFRFNADGSLDTGYGSSGMGSISFSGYNVSQTYGGPALQADGKLVVAAALLASGGSEWDLGLARLNTDGSLDPIRGQEWIRNQNGIT